MRFAVVLFSVIGAALAQLTVNTPTGAITCLNQQITWTGGTAPYTIQIQPGGDPSQAAIQTFTGLTGTSYTWFVSEAANTQVFIRIRDNTGTTAESGTFTIQAGGTCTSTPATGATSAAATTSGAAATTPAVTTPVATTPVATTPVATTPVTTPATGGAGTTTTPAAGGATTSTTHATTSTGAGMLGKGVQGGLVVGAVMGVVALLA